MEKTLQDLADLVLAAIPTIVLVVVLHIYLKAVFFRPLEKVLAERLGLSRVAQNFLFVVIQHGRASELKGIYESLLEAIDIRRDVVRADILSAAELSAPERQVLEEKLVAITGKKVRAVYSVDSKLLGGVLVRIGSQLYDGSVRGRLNAIGARLTATA